MISMCYQEARPLFDASCWRRWAERVAGSAAGGAQAPFLWRKGGEGRALPKPTCGSNDLVGDSLGILSFMLCFNKKP